MMRGTWFVCLLVVLAGTSIATLATCPAGTTSITLYTSGQNHNGNNWVSLPTYNGYYDADTVFDLIPNCNEVAQWDDTTGAFLQWDEFIFTDNFDIAPCGVSNGMALQVKVSTDCEWCISGADIPYGCTQVTISLYADDGDNEGLNYVSLPYNLAAGNADELFDDISNCTEVALAVEGDTSYQTWNGSSGTNFSISPGKAVRVKVSQDTNWTPTVQ